MTIGASNTLQVRRKNRDRLPRTRRKDLEDTNMASDATHDPRRLIEEISEITEDLRSAQGDFSVEAVWARQLLCACLTHRLDVLQQAGRNAATY